MDLPRRRRIRLDHDPDLRSTPNTDSAWPESLSPQHEEVTALRPIAIDRRTCSCPHRWRRDVRAHHAVRDEAEHATGTVVDLSRERESEGTVAFYPVLRFMTAKGETIEFVSSSGSSAVRVAGRSRWGSLNRPQLTSNGTNLAARRAQPDGGSAPGSRSYSTTSGRGADMPASRSATVSAVTLAAPNAST